MESTIQTQHLLSCLHAWIDHPGPDENVTDIARVGQQLHLAGEPEAALKAFEIAAAGAPEVVSYWHAVATLRMQLKLPKAALGACNRALEIDPNDADSLCNTAMVLEELGDMHAALHCYDKALQLAPRHIRALRNRPMLHAQLDQRDLAIRMAEAAIAEYPDDPGLHFNLGELYLGTSEPLRAVLAYQQCLKLDPEFRLAPYAMSIALAGAGKVQEAFSLQQTALANNPNLPSEYKSPIRMDEAHGTHDVSPDRVAMLAIADAFRIFDWRDYTDAIKLFCELIRGEHGCPPLSSKETAYLSMQVAAPMNSALRQQLARQIAQRACSNVSGMQLARSRRSSRDKIRIGYIAACFLPHPVSQLMGNAYANHDRDRFEVYAYALGPASDSFERRRVRQTVDVFREIAHLPPYSIAQIIANDEIDILIDLSGYNRDTRPEILALRPAPIQVNYIDFMTTTGAPFYDYTMLDRPTLTTEDRVYWDEKIAYLPHCSYHCELPGELPPSPSRAELGLPEDAIVLGALHHPRKLDPLSVKVWLSLLHDIPNSVLWLLHENTVQVCNMQGLAAHAGLAPDRVVFSPLRPRLEYLSCYRHVHVHLDPFVYNGHTTTTDALGMGVPMVTLTGDCVVSRVATTMVTAHGLPELAARTPEQYKAIVQKLVSDRAWYAQIKARVEQPIHGNLFCPERRIREIESAYQMMWARHEAGLPPDDFDVPEYRQT